MQAFTEQQQRGRCKFDRSLSLLTFRCPCRLPIKVFSRKCRRNAPPASPPPTSLLCVSFLPSSCLLEPTYAQNVLASGAIQLVIAHYIIHDQVGENTSVSANINLPHKVLNFALQPTLLSPPGLEVTLTAPSTSSNYVLLAVLTLTVPSQKRIQIPRDPRSICHSRFLAALSLLQSSLSQLDICDR